MRVLLTGDSIIARREGLTMPRLNFNLQQKLPGIELTNTAVSGINSAAFFAEISELVLRQEKHDLLVILLGSNDLALHKQVPLKQFKQNMSLIAAAVICEYYPPRVILVSPPAVDENKQRVRNNKLVLAYAQAVEEVAKEYGFPFINLAQAMIATGDLPHVCQGLKNDGLHFGQQGYNLLASLLAAQIKRLAQEKNFS